MRAFYLEDLAESRSGILLERVFTGGAGRAEVQMTLLMSDADWAERTGMHSSQDIVCKDLVNPETDDPQRRRT